MTCTDACARWRGGRAGAEGFLYIFLLNPYHNPVVLSGEGAPQGAFGNVWRQLRLSRLVAGGGCYWHVWHVTGVATCAANHSARHRTAPQRTSNLSHMSTTEAGKP